MSQLWRCERTLNRPSAPNPALYYAGEKCQMLIPRRNTHGFTVKCEELISSRVSALLKVSSPTAIGFAIWTIVVNSFQRMFRRWLWSHIFKEGSEVAPLSANFNPPSSVMHPRYVMWILAACFHCHPRPVFTGKSHAVSLVSARYVLCAQTSAGFRAAAGKVTCAYRYHSAAIAKARPHVVITAWRFMFSSQRHNGEPIEFTSSKVLKTLAGWMIAWNDFGRIDVFTHIGFSEDRSLTGAAVFALFMVE